MKVKLIKPTLLLIMGTQFLIGCNPLSPNDGGGKIKNSLSQEIEYGYGYVLLDDPISLTQNENLSRTENLTSLISRSGQFISNGSTLTATCSFSDGYTTASLSNCFKVLNNRNSTPTPPINGKWPYVPGTKEFLDVNTYYHSNKAISLYNTGLGFGLNRSYLFANSSLPGGVVSDKSFWDKDTITTFNKTLSIFSDCNEIAGNASFNPAKFEVCFGSSTLESSFKFSTDPDIVYHELGHMFIKNMLNIRNRVTPITTLNTDLGRGSSFYSEASAINEGLADFLTYLNTQRTIFSRWALGFESYPRLMSESQPDHAPGISETTDGRLFYPTYVNYAAQISETLHRACDWSGGAYKCGDKSHQAGQIVSSFMVALTKDLKTTCGFDHTNASKYMIALLSETFAELGDIKNNGNNNSALFGNFSNITSSGESYAYDWTMTTNPINMRRFFQTFSRKTLGLIPSIFVCPLYTQNQLEKLLDNYGLLLFKSYNDNGNDKNKGQTAPQGTGTVAITQVSNANRLKTVLVSKSLVGFPTGAGATKAYVFDNQLQIRSILESMSFGGNPITISTMTPADLRFNNGNGKISPGEVIGLALNLKNTSNSTVGGVQILANDWDHGEKYSITNTKLKPCKLSDGFPLETEGGSTAAECSTGDEANLLPICYVQYRSANETKWISQKEFKSLNSDFDCLDNTKPESCLLRSIPQMNSAFYSKIDPGKTWGETLTSGLTNASTTYSAGNIMLFEVNKWIPPGTSFMCRFRARFTNCSDCYHDPARASSDNDDYRDNDFAAEAPFRLLNLQFTVTD